VTKFAAFYYKYRMVQKCLGTRGSVLNNECQVTFVPLCTAYVTLLVPSVYTRKLYKHPFQTCTQICEKKRLFSSVMSVCPSACKISAPTGRIFVKFDIPIFFANLTKRSMYPHVNIALNSSSNEKYFRHICRENQNTRSLFNKLSPKIVLFVR
jgi:hypothetical protein